MENEYPIKYELKIDHYLVYEVLVDGKIIGMIKWSRDQYDEYLTISTPKEKSEKMKKNNLQLAVRRLFDLYYQEIIEK